VLEDVLSLGGCTLRESDCWQQLPELLDAERIVFGTLSVDDGKVVVELTLIEPGQPSLARRITLSSTTTAELARELVPHAEAFFLRQDPPVAKPDGENGDGGKPSDDGTRPDVPLIPDGGKPAAAPRDDGFSFGRVGGLAWGTTVLGVGALATGVTLLYLANQKQADVNSAPTDTVEDLQRLADLERSGKNLSTWGNRALIGGGAVTALGVVLIIVQGQSSSPSEPRVSLAPVWGQGAVGAMFTFGGTL